jgi:homoserine dehydrogenase
MRTTLETERACRSASERRSCRTRSKDGGQPCSHWYASSLFTLFCSSNPGVGGVGKEFLSQLVHGGHCPSKFNIILVANSKTVYSSRDYSAVPPDQVLSLLHSSENPSFLSNLQNYISYLQTSPQPVILLDNTASDDMSSAYPAILSAGNIHIATPNKRAFSADQSLFDQIFKAAKAHKTLVYHEATVGAGLPIICTLRDLVATGDKINRIEGVFSGTLSYIFNEWSPTLPNTKSPPPSFSQVVGIAKTKGYTEPDPREDLNGLDVARKLTILSRLINVKVDNLASLPVESLIPDKLTGCKSVDEFMKSLPEFDNDFQILADSAAKEGKVVRFVGSIDAPTGEVKVQMQKVDKSHSFASLKGSDNIIAFYTERYSNTPLIIQGSGYDYKSRKSRKC